MRYSVVQMDLGDPFKPGVKEPDNLILEERPRF